MAKPRPVSTWGEGEGHPAIEQVEGPELPPRPSQPSSVGPSIFLKQENVAQQALPDLANGPTREGFDVRRLDQLFDLIRSLQQRLDACEGPSNPAPHPAVQTSQPQPHLSDLSQASRA